MRQGSRHGLGQAAQGLLELATFGLAGHGGADAAPPRGLDGQAVHGRERLQVALEQLAEVGDLAARPARQGRERVRRYVSVRIAEPVEQGLLLGHRRAGVEPGPWAALQLARQAPAVQPRRIQLDARAGGGRTTALLGQHDLVRHRRQVDLVGLLMQVVGRRQILLAEEVTDVRRLTVRRFSPPDRKGSL